MNEQGQTPAQQDGEQEKVELDDLDAKDDTKGGTLQSMSNLSKHLKTGAGTDAIHRSSLGGHDLE